MPLTGPPRAAAGSASDPASVASRLPRPTGPSPKRSGPSVVTPTSRRPCPPGEADSSRHPVGPGSSKSPRSGSFRTFPIAKDWHGLAQPLWTLRVVLPGHGGDRFHPAVLAALPRRERTLGPRDRDCLDPGVVAGRGEPGPGRSGERPLCRGGGRVGERPSGRPEKIGRGASDRRVVSGPGLGAGAGGVGFSGRSTRLPGAVCVPGGPRRGGDGDRGAGPGDPGPG